MKKFSKDAMGRLYLTSAFTLAGSSVVAARFISDYLPTFATTFLGLVIGSLTAVILCGGQMYRTAKQLSKRTWFVIVLQALFGSFLFRVFLTLGLQHIGTAEAGIVTGATPAITALFTWIMLREKISRRTVVGILLTFAGILLVQGFPFVSLENLNLLGAFLVLCSAACESLFTTLSRKILGSGQESESLPPLIHAGFVSILAMIFSLIPTIMERPWFAISKLPVSGWAALGWYGSIVTIVAFTCMFAGAKRCDGYTIAAFAGVIPISSTVLSVTILREPISVYQIAGCLFVVLATIIISGKGKGQRPVT